MSDVDISQIVDSQITIDDNFPSRVGFSTLLILAYHTFSLARVLTYRRGDEVDDDFPSGHHVRTAVRAAFSQNPRISTVKVGRRDGAPTQTIRYTPINTDAGRVYSGSIGGVEWTYTADASPTVAEICAGITAAIDATSLGADPDAIMLALATSASIQTLDTELDGVIGTDAISPPRKITVTRSAHADQDAVTAVLTGTDEFGATQSENLTFANNGGEVVTSTKRYASVTSLVIPAQAGTGGTTSIGIAAAVDATDATTHVDVAATVAGTWFPHRFGTADGGALPASMMHVEDRTAEPGTTIDDDLSEISDVDSDWYGLVVADGQSSAQLQAADTWAETAGKLHLGDTFDSDVPDGEITTDVVSVLASAETVTTGILYHRNGSGYFPCCRWFGNVLPRPEGTTFALKTLTGLPVDDLTASERTALEAKGANYYARVAGAGRVLGPDNGGKTAGGRFLDLVLYSAFTNARVQEALVQIIGAGDELPLDDKGITALKNGIEGVLAAGERRRKLRNIIVTAPTADEIETADRAARIAGDLEWDAIYIGATQKARVRGRVAL